MSKKYNFFRILRNMKIVHQTKKEFHVSYLFHLSFCSATADINQDSQNALNQYSLAMIAFS